MIRKILTIIMGGFVFASTAFAQDPTAKLDSKPLKVYGDSVEFEATITVPKHKVFKKEGTYVILPEIGEFKLTPIRIPSSDMDNIRQNGINVTIRASIPFDEDMIGNDLEIEHEYEYRNGEKNVEFRDMDDLAECCITTGTLFALNGQYELMNYDYRPAVEVPLKVIAQVNFPLDISKFAPSETKSIIQEIGTFIKTYPTATITIRGFASPEGTVERNKELGFERANEVKTWLTKALKKNGYGAYFHADKIKMVNEKEDWEGFKYMVAKSDMKDETKDKLMEILASDKNAKQKEDAMLAALGSRKDAEKYLMPLRRTTIVVEDKYAMRAGYSINQIDSVRAKYEAGDLTLSGLKDVFTQEEMLAASQRTEASHGKFTMLTSYYKTYPADVRAYSNLGALTAVDMTKIDVVGGDDALVGIGFSRDMVDIDREFDLDKDKLKYKYKYKEEDVEDGKKIKYKMKQDLADAEVLIMKAYHAQPDNFVVLNNMGAHYITVGEYAKAKEYLDKSAKYQDSDGVNYNLGVYHARMGNYNKAYEHFKKAGKVENIEYNRGLAALMINENQQALQDLKAFAQKNAQYALGHYLTAIAAARVNDTKTLARELEHAINRNVRLSDIAQEDLEFRKYWDEDWFEDASDDNFTETSGVGGK